MLEDQLKTSVKISSVDFRPINKILLNDVFITDLNKDTLLYSKTIKASLFWFNREENSLILQRVSLDNALLNFYTDSTGAMNLTSLLDKLSSDTSSTEGGESMGIEIRNLSLINSTFRLSEFNPPVVDFGINFSDLNLRNMNLDARDFGMFGDTIRLTINSLSFKEKSGFNAENLRSEFSMSSKHIAFDKLRVKAEGSNLQLPYLRLNFDGWDKLSDFFNGVKLDIDIRQSYLTTNFLSYFVPELQNLELGFAIKGKIKGPLSDIRGRNIVLSTGTQTILSTNFNISGLPDIEQSMMRVDIKELSTSYYDLVSIKEKGKNTPLIDLPSDLAHLQKITYRGNFTGYLNNFVADGSLTSAIGQLFLDLSIKPDVSENTEFNGQISVNNIDLGILSGSSSLGKVSLDALVKGVSDKKANISAYTDATIHKLEANKYEYSNIKITGNLTNRTYIGSIFLDDPNCKLNFLGKLDFSDTIPVFDFSAFVPKIDLVKLHLNTTDSISQTSFLFTAKFQGSNLDNSKGEIKIVNSYYKNQNGDFKLSDIVINADNNADSKVISLKSEFAEGELRGKYNYSNIFEGLQNLMYIYLPALKPNQEESKPTVAAAVVSNPEFNDYIIKFRLKKTRKITEVVAPDIQFTENTSIFGIFNPDLQTLTLKVKIPEIAFGSNIFKDISIDGITKDSIFEASITTPVIDLGGSLIKNLHLNSIISNNKLDFSFGWDNKMTSRNLGEIKALVDFNPSSLKNESIAEIHFKPSNFIINDSVWNIQPSTIRVDTNNIIINNFNIENQQQALSINGNISEYFQDSIMLNLKNIDLSNLNFYMQTLGYKLSGRIGGYAKVSGILKNPTLFADIGINKMVVNTREIGNVQFNSEWYNTEKRLAINLLNTKNDTVTFDLKGDIYTETSKMDFKINIQQLLLVHLEPFLQGNLSNLAGSLRGNLRITGTTDKPNVNGNINIDKGKLTVDFMMTKYTINDHIDFENSDIVFNNFKIQDSHHKTAMVNGKIKTSFFNDISLNLNISPDNFQCLNTKEKDNELFYGTVYASGLVSVTGKLDDLLVNIGVRTEPKTILYLPLTSTGTVAENNFITFTNSNTDDIYIEETIVLPPEQASNMLLNFDLQVTPEAEVQIIIDKKMGDIIKASGSGNLKMEVNPATEVFKIYGDYIIEKGDYLFTLQGVINKKFKIEEGSSISWSGDPIDANMNIKAVYKVKTALYQLLMSDDERYKSRVPVDCQILLTQKLMAPGIKFNIDVPTADSETKALISSALSTEESINKNFLSLLVINSFLPPDISTIGGTTQQTDENSSLGSGISNTVSEMLSNQLSNWLSQWSKSFDIGLNYRPGSPSSEVSSDEVELAISTQLFNDRVTINGNVDMGSRNTSSPIAGDFNMDVKLNKSGKLRFKAFARTNDELIKTEQNQYTTGAGILYREEFNNLYDLLHRVKHTFKQEEIQIPLEEDEPDTKRDSTVTSTEEIKFVEI